MIKRGILLLHAFIIVCMYITTSFATTYSQEEIIKSLICQRTDTLNMYYAGQANKKDTMEKIELITTDYLKESDLQNLENFFQCDLERPVGYEFAKIDITYSDDDVICALVTIDWTSEGIKGRENFSHTYSIICEKEENLYKLAQFF